MNFIEIVLILFPGILAADNYRRINKDNLNWGRFIVNAAIFTLFISFIEIAFIYIRGWSEFTFTNMTATFMVKYMGLGILLAYVIPYVYRAAEYTIGKYFTGSIEEK